MAFNGYLTPQQITELTKAALSGGLIQAPRQVLLAGIPPAFAATLPLADSPLDQFALDLVRVNGVERMAGGEVPAAILLRNAAEWMRLVGREEAEIFERALNSVPNAAGPPASGPQAIPKALTAAESAPEQAKATGKLGGGLAAQPADSTPAGGHEKKGRVGNAARRGRQILSGQYSVAILSGIVATVVGGMLLALLLAFFNSSPSGNHASVTDKPTARTPPLTAANCPGMQQASTPPQLRYPPLAVISEDPMDVVLGTSYAFPGQHVLSPAALIRLDSSQASGGSGSGAYLASIGGYAVGTSGTQLVVQNTSRYKIRILGIRAIKESCQPPLTGTIFANSSSGADLSINLGFDLDSPDSEARAIKGLAVTPADPNYFNEYTVSISPRKQQVFNLIAQTAQHAWSFEYQMTMLDGTRRIYQLIGNGKQPFRVTSPPPASHLYSVAYIGGVASPAHNGSWVRVNPRSISGY